MVSGRSAAIRQGEIIEAGGQAGRNGGAQVMGGDEAGAQGGRRSRLKSDLGVGAQIETVQLNVGGVAGLALVRQHLRKLGCTYVHRESGRQGVIAPVWVGDGEVIHSHRHSGWNRRL